jgi:hypothetical protein
MIGREEARLRALFRALLVASTSSAIACSSSDQGAGQDASVQGAGDAGGGPDGALADATLAADGGVPVGDDAAADATDDADGAIDYGFADAACDPSYLDGASDGACQYYVALPCGLPPKTATEQCNLGLGSCALLCDQFLGRPCAVAECLAEDAGADAFIPSGAITLECTTGLSGCGTGVGRRPGALADAAPVRCDDAEGAWLASVAHLEAASVVAFRRLRRELASFGAPRALVRAAARAARDEARHARVTSALARRRGAKAPPVRTGRARGPRSIEDLAVENAVEGCVRETYGALVATRQASRAEDPRVARAMARIAEDETRHAALAWAIAEWAAPRLGDAGRARVGRAIAGAIAALRCDAGSGTSPAARALGLPDAREARALVDAFAASAFGRGDRVSSTARPG